jgi:3-hydroxybutyryl-CoA dehydrogenase
VSKVVTSKKTQLGVVGAGTMGSGIGLIALYADFDVVLYDVDEDVLEDAAAYIAKYLERREMQARMAQLVLSSDMGALTDCEIVIEASPEDLELKQSIFVKLERICPETAILASNTSTLSLSAIGRDLKEPGRMAGLHFFNPAALMPLVEIGRTERTSEETIQRLLLLCEQLEKTPVIARDTPGFIVNRVARPFYGEALRLLGEGAASHEQIDELTRMAGGFRMGPFELMDLIGLDINLAATLSMFEQTHGEPRYRPHVIQQNLVREGRLGRKSGQGFYSYKEDDLTQEGKPHSPGISHGEGMVLLTEGGLGPRLSEWISKGGFSLWETHGGPPVMAVIAASREEGLEAAVRKYDQNLGPNIPILCQAVAVTAAEVRTWMQHPQRLVGFDSLFFVNGPAATLVAGDETTQSVQDQVAQFIWGQDTPGLILPRIVCCLANEAAFALGEGVASQQDIDLAMKLGANYPHGPLEWARNLGARAVVQVLDHLMAEYGEDRYRVAPLMRRWARTESRE